MITSFKLFEYRNQLELPFDGKHPLHDKPVHVHILDLIEDLSKECKTKPKDYFSEDDNISSHWKDNYEDGKRMYIDYSDEYPYSAASNMFNEYPPKEKDNRGYYTEEFLKELEEDEGIIDYKYSEELDDILTQKGLDILDNNIMDICFEDDLNEYDVEWILKQNQDDDRLIDIWRAVSYDKDDKLDVYQSAKRHSGVGLYWSYEESAAEPHGGSYDNTFVLHGKVKPEYVNWSNTIHKSAWNLKEEKEVELNEDAEVLIYKITEYKGDKELPLKKEIVVEV
jgi:hypothetical protein